MQYLDNEIKKQKQIKLYLQVWNFLCWDNWPNIYFFLMLRNKYFLLHIKKVNISTYQVMYYISHLVKEKKSLGL